MKPTPGSGAKHDLPDNIVSTDGGRALYTCQDSGGNEQLYYVNVANGAKTVIAPDSGNVTFPAMSPNGAYARFSGAGHYHTRVNLDTLKKRDTGSYWFGEAEAGDREQQSHRSHGRQPLLFPGERTRRQHIPDPPNRYGAQWQHGASPGYNRHQPW